MERYQNVMVAPLESVMKKSPEAPPSGEITMTSYPACNKASLSGKPCIPDKSYYITLSGSHGGCFRIQFSRTIAQKTRSGVKKTLLGMRYVQFCFALKTPLKLVGMGNYPPK